MWENTTSEEVLKKVREEIRRSWREICDLNNEHPHAAELFDPEKMPGLHDPFAGGGTIPLEAQRLGLEAYASDLNPVAVLINKAMIEIPPKFAGMSPVNPNSRKKYPLGTKQWHGAEGLADDIRYYGKWMRDEAEKRIGPLYPKVEITEEMTKARPDLEPYLGQKLTIIAWLWARTVRSPNPAFSHIDVPLVSTYYLSAKPGQEAYLEVVIDDNNYKFEVRLGHPTDVESVRAGTKLARGSFKCVFSGTPFDYSYIDDEANAGRMHARLMAIVAKGDSGRVFLSPSPEFESTACASNPTWKPDAPSRGTWASNAQGRRYGFNTFGDYYTPRQLVALTTLSDLIPDVIQQLLRDASEAGVAVDETTLAAHGSGITAYAESIGLYLAFANDKVAEGSTTLCTWSSLPTKLHIVSTFGRQAIQMTWDFAEANIFGDSSGNVERMCNLVANTVERQSAIDVIRGTSEQLDASQIECTDRRIISTDPPYYDNIGYADLSDFFYVWLRRALRSSFPGLFATVAVPKATELVACAYRHGGRENAEKFFLSGMREVMLRINELSHPGFPITIYYAFKQAESTNSGGVSSTGWDAFLDALIKSGFAISGTWPIRTEKSGGFRNNNQNALASSIVLVCRVRSSDAKPISRREFIRELNSALPIALDAMTRESEGLPSPVAPVDLSQAIIGPGMSIFSKYSAVLEADGTPMTVRTALQLINRFLAEDDFDADTQFCLHWFDGHGWGDGVFGEADVLARAKATSVNGLVEAGVLRSGGGKVQLLRPAEFSSDWVPEKDNRIPIWEVLHQLIRAVRNGGETEAGLLLSKPSVQSRAEAARQLAYRLYTLCERKGWAEDARAYNEVVTSWSGIESAAAKEPTATQRTLFE